MTRLVLALLALFALPLVSPAIAADANDCGYVQGNGGWYKRDDRSGPYALTASCTATLLGSGGGGSGGGASTVTGSQEQDVRGTGTLNAASTTSTLVIPINGQSTLGLTFTGLAASGATVTYEQSIDGGTTWTGVNEVNAGTGVTAATRNTDGQVRIAAQGRTNLRIRVSTAGTGTITVASNVSVREGLVTLASPLPPGTNAIGTVNVGNPYLTTTANSLAPPTSAGGKKVRASVALAANTSTTLLVANANRYSYAVQCATGGVVLDETGGALTGATVGNGTTFLPANPGVRFSPEVASLTAVTAYTATAQTCVATEDVR